jgi:ubiquinone/menaquinone biosynthesis C-methylase UbiE
MDTKKLYDMKYFRGSRKFQRRGGRLDELEKIILDYKPQTVLDVGCGIGFLVRRLRDNGIETTGVDFANVLPGVYWEDEETYFIVADAKNLPFKDKSYDVVVSSDFFEHLSEEDIDQVVSEMLRVGKVVLARVAYEAVITPKQARYHTTNKPKEWWEEKLKGIKLI